MNKRTIQRNARQIVRQAVSMKSGWEPWDDPDERHTESIFLGTVFNLSPSGKYYMPWACSNVDPCPRCKGNGRKYTKLDVMFNTYTTCDYCDGIGSREAYEDQVFYEALDAAASKHECWIESGEGDPCDIFLVRNVKEQDNE